MSKNTNEGNYYKETLHEEVDKIPEHDTTFLVQLINLIRVHIRRTGER